MDSKEVTQGSEELAVVALVVIMPHLLAHNALPLFGRGWLYSREPPHVDVGFGHSQEFRTSRGKINRRLGVFWFVHTHLSAFRSMLASIHATPTGVTCSCIISFNPFGDRPCL